MKSNRTALALLPLFMKALFQAIPMLAGRTAKQTNNNSSLIIEVEEGKATDFSTGSAPVFISGDDFLFHSGKYDNEFYAAVYKRRFIWPVFPKKRITEEEHRRMEKFLSERKNTALNRKGWN